MANTSHTTAEQPFSKTREEIIKEARRIEEGLLYSSKGHFYASSFWSHFHIVVGLPLVILSAVVATSAFKNSTNNETSFWALALPIAVAVLSAMITFLNPSERATAHLKAGNEYDSLMNKTRIFRSIDCLGSEPDKVLASRVQNLSEEKGKINGASPQIPFWAYKWAQRGISRGEGDYVVDKPVE